MFADFFSIVRTDDLANATKSNFFRVAANKWHKLNFRNGLEEGNPVILVADIKCCY